MATTIACNEHIPIYTPEEVFAVGTALNTLPELDGFILRSRAEHFAMGVEVKIGLVVAHHNFSLKAQVTEFEPSSHVMIRGVSHIGKAAVWLDLEPDEELGGTQIGYGISIKHGLATRLAEPMVAHHLKETVPMFAAGYKSNSPKKNLFFDFSRT